MGLLNPVFFLFSSLVFPLAGGAVQARLTPDQIRPLIPRTFPEGDSRDLSPYTVRYLSTDNSSEDSPACLGNQLRNDSTRVDCHTLRYSLGRVDDPVTNEESHIFNSSYLILVVFPGEYPYSVSSNRNLEVRNFTNIIIARHPYPQTQRHGDGKVIFKCQSLDDENFNNFYVREVTNIAFTGITFAHCGERSTGLTIRVGRNVIVESCTFTDNSGGGVVIKESKEIFILNSVFKDNLVNSPYRYFSDLTVDNRKGAGLTLFFIGGEGPGYTLIKNCTFENNLAGLNQSNEEDAKTRPILYIPRGHGGSLLLSFQNTEEHRVNITNCTFRNGFAHFAGGAIAVQFYRGAANTEVVQRSSHGNLVSISKSMFVNNTCQEDGGAISVSAFETANRNKVEVRQSLFSDNWAGGNGGAFSHVIEDNIVTRENASLDNTAVIQTSNFTCNFAQRGGGAISLTTNARSDQATEVFNISDCNFTGNSGKGAVLSLRYPVSLQGSNNFTENNGGAIILFGAPLTITGQALFQANTAWVGAAIEMLDYSTVDIQSGANVMFWGNRAMRKGGAIMVVELILTGDVYASTIRRNSQSCFILLPGNSSSSDRVNISFIDNSAGEAGGAIYTTDLSICLQKNVSTEDKVDYMKDTIFEDEQFLFRSKMKIAL